MTTQPPPVEAGFDLWAPYEALRARLRGWVADYILPWVDEWEAAGAFPRELFAAAGEAGLFGWKTDAAHGGTGPDLLADAVVGEELAACWSGGVSAGLGAHKDLGPYYIWRFGTPEQRRRWVPDCLAGRLVGALGVTEPGAGSDVAGMRTRARRDAGGDWILDGTKTFITNGGWADLVVVAAITDADAGGHHGSTLFVVERGDRGFSSTRIPTLGWCTSSTAELTFDGVRLPADRVLGGDEMLGQGFVCIMRNFQWERLGMALGAVRAAEEVLAVVPDTPSAVADEAAAARALTEHALRLHVSGADAVREVSMAKWYACEVAVRASEAALDVLGPEGLRAGRLERSLRDARLGPIGGGTTQIMKEVVGRTLDV